MIKLKKNFGMMEINLVKKLLKTIIDSITDVKIDKKYNDIKIEGITLDSRKVEKGFLFAALKGVKADGSEFIAGAIAAGAAVIICDNDVNVKVPDEVCLIKHENPRMLFSKIAAAFYDKQPEVVAAVTGTNGKTSTVHFCREIWKNLGKHSASIGTVGIYDSNGKYQYDRSNFLTTPDTVKLHQIIYELTENGVTHMAMEASSHGLDQFRLDGVAIKIAAFTNLTRDHLDYHGNFENYLAAKLRLFKDVMKEGGIAVLNSDIPEFDKLLAECEKHGHKVISYGKYKDGGRKNYIEIFSISNTSEGQQISFEILDKVYNINTSLIGEFQAYNLLCALGMVLGSGCNVDEAVAALEHVTCVPGRMERVGNAVFVDYAHTPDALEKALSVLRPHTRGKLWVVFGCGGDRDKGKRPLMGRVAAQLADNVIITDDNPRSEDPAAVRKDIAAAFGSDEVMEIGDRKAAIAYAVGNMKKGDMLLIAGKGHEKTQTIGTQVLPFDDVEVARGVLVGV
jgi:UDP-N-acetylmuramoyl-L-alanyl-D-glutamate--2,6-diaminopimelate ligase